MALHSGSATLRTRLVSYGKNHCPQCNAVLIAADWSEYIDDRCVRHSSSCDDCGYEFETTIYISRPE
jgi:phage FluMu protein Com